MLLVEKVLMLKSTDLFRDCPEQILIDLAMVMEFIQAETGTSLFTKGNEASGMYILLSGKVQVHDETHIFAELSDGDFFGELSLLDAEPRSASVTTLTDCELLQLRQGPFYEAITGNAEMLKGILRTLCKRIRQMDSNAADLGRKLLTVGQ